MTRPSTNLVTPQPTVSQPLSGWRLWWRFCKRLAWVSGGVCLLALLVGLAWLMLAAPAGKRALAGKAHPYFRCPCPLVLAHQGASGHAPSNTLASFRMALAMGADILELDIHQSADGVLVVAHDAHVRRHTNGRGQIKEMTWAALQKLDAGYRFSQDGQRFPFRGKGIRIPSLEQVLKAFPTTRINIEIKQQNPPIARALWETLAKHRAQGRVMVGSFWTAPLQSFRALSKGQVATSASIRQVLRFLAWWRLGLGGSWEGNIDALQIPHTPSMGRSWGAFVTSPEVIAMAHRHDRFVHAWTVNQPRHMQALLRQGVDGLITDFPDRARKVMAALGLRKAVPSRLRKPAPAR